MTPIVESKDETFQRQFEELYRKYKQRLYLAAYRVIGNREDAEDVLHNVFVKLMEGPPPGDFMKNPEAYLYQATINAARNAVRWRERRKRTHVHVESVAIPARENDGNLEDRIDSARVAMAKMKPNLVETLNLYYKEGLSCRKIAKIRRKALGTVVADLYRGRIELKRRIGSQEKTR